MSWASFTEWQRKCQFRPTRRDASSWDSSMPWQCCHYSRVESESWILMRVGWTRQTSLARCGVLLNHQPLSRWSPSATGLLWLLLWTPRAVSTIAWLRPTRTRTWWWYILNIWWNSLTCHAQAGETILCCCLMEPGTILARVWGSTWESWSWMWYGLGHTPIPRLRLRWCLVHSSLVSSIQTRSQLGSV